MTNSYFKAFSARPQVLYFEQRTAFSPPQTIGYVEEYFFFDTKDPASVSGAERKAMAFKDRHLGCRIQVSVWRSVPGLHWSEIGRPVVGARLRAA